MGEGDFALNGHLRPAAGQEPGMLQSAAGEGPGLVHYAGKARRAPAPATETMRWRPAAPV